MRRAARNGRDTVIKKTQLYAVITKKGTAGDEDESDQTDMQFPFVTCPSANTSKGIVRLLVRGSMLSSLINSSGCLSATGCPAISTGLSPRPDSIDQK